ncbi:MAG: hypothetical protein FWF63_07950, partial [Fibromonadales bacterium]|nr:hypothetical protein [Fibromonadales bacterium]
GGGGGGGTIHIQTFFICVTNHARIAYVRVGMIFAHRKKRGLKTAFRACTASPTKNCFAAENHIWV